MAQQRTLFAKRNSTVDLQTFKHCKESEQLAQADQRSSYIRVLLLLCLCFLYKLIMFFIRSVTHT